MKYTCIEEHRRRFRLSIMCQALEVTRRPDGVGGADGHVAREPAEHRVDVDVRARVWVARGARETGVRPGDAHATPLVHS